MSYCYLHEYYLNDVISLFSDKKLLTSNVIFAFNLLVFSTRNKNSLLIFSMAKLCVHCSLFSLILIQRYARFKRVYLKLLFKLLIWALLSWVITQLRHCYLLTVKYIRKEICGNHAIS